LALCILKTAESLANEGINLVKVGPNSKGIVEPNSFLKEVDENTYLTSLMFANNEVGTLEPIKEVCKIAHSKGSYFFTDAVQGVGALPIDVKDLNVDMLSISAHKFNGPKGVGAVYIKNGVKIGGQILGGHQEREKRGGTSNVAGAIGLAYALKYTKESMLEDIKYVTSLRDYFITKMLNLNLNISLNGDNLKRLPNNANLLFSGVNGESLLYQLDLKGVCASLGAACSAGSIAPSHVLTEMGISERDAKSSIRFTFGRENTFEEVDRVVNIIKEILQNN
jgi:cysteine desulfurase